MPQNPHLEWTQPPGSFTETRGTENNRLNKLSQMTTHWFVIDGLDIWKAQKSEVRQAANDVVKSEV